MVARRLHRGLRLIPVRSRLKRDGSLVEIGIKEFSVRCSAVSQSKWSRASARAPARSLAANWGMIDQFSDGLGDRRRITRRAEQQIVLIDKRTIGMFSGCDNGHAIARQRGKRAVVQVDAVVEWQHECIGRMDRCRYVIM